MLQVILDSLVRSSQIALLAIGLTMVFSVLRFPNFSHVEFGPIGAYLALAVMALLGMPLLFAALLAIVLTGLLGIAADRIVFRRLRNRPAAVLLIASFALGIVMRESVQAIAGPSPYLYEVANTRLALELLDATISLTQLGIIGAALACMAFFHILLHYTKLGMAMRATADDKDLAQGSGIHAERIILWIWFIGAAFAGLGGILIALDTQLHPLMGFSMIIPVFAAVLIGGIGRPYGAMVGALIVGFAENVGLAINWSPLFEASSFATDGYVYIPTGYKDAIPFFFLILVLLFRPQGLLAERGR